MDISKLLAAMAEPTRLGAMQIVSEGGEHCVCELMDRLSSSQSRMSRHMKVLRDAGLVLDRRDAQWVRYRLNPNMAPDIRKVVDCVLSAAKNQERRAA